VEPGATASPPRASDRRLTAEEAWAAPTTLTCLGGGLFVLGTPARYGDPDGPAMGGAVAWRRYFDAQPGEVRLFGEISAGALQAAFTNERADLEVWQPSAPSLLGTLETDALYLLAMGRLGAEVWRTPAFRCTAWLGAGVGVERRSLDFVAPASSVWDDAYHRSVAAGEAGVGLELRLGAVGLELRVTALALLGDATPVGSAVGLGAGLGLRW
jgi:hypothetical protein